MKTLNLIVNRREVSVAIDPKTPLLDVLRNELDLTSPRFGCGEEQCGACQVKVGSHLMYACTTTVNEVQDAVTTIEGLGKLETPHPLQQALMNLNAGQCGYCLSGILVTASALLNANSAPSRSDVIAALDALLCRCGAHNRIINAILKAVEDS